MTTIFTPEPPNETAARRIEREIRRAIVTLEVLPGTPLSENELAERYGVSRQPIREALIALARAELVEIQPRRGTFVVRISADRMRQARFVRESLEVAVVRRACLAFDPKIRTRIETVLEVQANHAAAQEHYLFQREDEAFHAALAEGAGFPAAWSVMEDVKAHLDRVCHLSLPVPDALSRLVEQHRAIVDAIDARDPDAAEAAMRAHLGAILSALPAIEENYAYLFK